MQAADASTVLISAAGTAALPLCRALFGVSYPAIGAPLGTT